MAAETEFCLLGPLLVRHRGIMIPVAPDKQRVLLAALLLSAGRLVALDELAETLWGSVPPRSARASLRNYVMRLRKSLADGGLPRLTEMRLQALEARIGYQAGVGDSGQYRVGGAQ